MAHLGHLLVLFVPLSSTFSLLCSTVFITSFPASGICLFSFYGCFAKNQGNRRLDLELTSDCKKGSISTLRYEWMSILMLQPVFFASSKIDSLYCCNDHIG